MQTLVTYLSYRGYRRNIGRLIYKVLRKVIREYRAVFRNTKMFILFLRNARYRLFLGADQAYENYEDPR